MTKVTMYQAADGSLHKTLKEKEAHNAKLRLAPAVEKFVEGLFASNFSEDDRGNAVVLKGDLAALIISNADSLRRTLSESLIVRRPRKAKKAATTSATAQA